MEISTEAHLKSLLIRVFRDPSTGAVELIRVIDQKQSGTKTLLVTRSLIDAAATVRDWLFEGEITERDA